MLAEALAELENQFGSHKATEWCGHTEKIAEAHYWMVTADAVSKAADFVSDAHLLQKGAEEAGNGQFPKQKEQRILVISLLFRRRQLYLVGVEGLEPPTNEL